MKVESTNKKKCAGHTNVSYHAHFLDWIPESRDHRQRTIAILRGQPRHLEVRLKSTRDFSAAELAGNQAMLHFRHLILITRAKRELLGKALSLDMLSFHIEQSRAERGLLPNFGRDREFRDPQVTSRCRKGGSRYCARNDSVIDG